MHYFNGFSLKGEEILFSDFLVHNKQTVAGFSYGAQQAFEYVYNTKERVDRLILLSPAFFQTQKSSFHRTQLRYFETDKETYIQQFLKNVIFPSNLHLSSCLQIGKKRELELLLTYRWEEEKIEEILQRGTSIEVFLGEKDKIIQSQDAFSFFSKLTTTYFIKNVGHLLQR